MLTRDQIKAIEERESKATKGPWCLHWISWGIRHLNRNCDFDECQEHGDKCYAHPSRDVGDYEFISNSRSDILALLSDLRQLREWLRQCFNNEVADMETEAAIDAYLKEHPV